MGLSIPLESAEVASTLSERDRALAEVGLRTLRELDAIGVAVYLPAPHAPVVRAGLVAVTPMGIGLLEKIPAAEDVYPSARAYRSGKVVRGTARDLVGQDPGILSFSPFYYAISAAPLISGEAKTYGTLSAYWPHGCTISDDSAEYLREEAGGLAARLSALDREGVSLVPPDVPLVIAGETRTGGSDRYAPLLFHLNKLAILLNKATSPEEAADLAIQRIVHGFAASAAAVSLTSGDRLVVLDAEGCSSEYLKSLNGASIAAALPESEAITHRRPYSYERTDPRTRDRLRGEEERGQCFWEVLPLAVGEYTIGAVSIGFDARRQEVGEHTLIALSSMLADALERTRWHEAQHALARQLQETLLPRTLPQLPSVLSVSRYRPATGGIELGGDWYDLFDLPGGGVGVVIGDVEGHNTQAAVVMGQLRSAVRAYAAEGHGPAAVLTRANRLLCDLRSGLLATCCCLWLAPDTGRARISTAGHPVPLVRSGDGEFRTYKPDAGVPLGVDAGFEFTASEMSLDTGTLLAFYTDGVTGQGHELATDELESAIQATGSELESLADRLISEPDTHSARRSDDAALLLVRYEGSPLRHMHNLRQLHLYRGDFRGANKARKLLRVWLEGWELAAVADEAELLMSEVVTNGLVHGGSDVSVYVRKYDRCIRVEVRDSDPRPARQRFRSAESDQAEGGRGLLIVSALASVWGNSPSGRGKTVWFELPTP
ncbi:hypothetical protein GCM10018793_27110 [Streptomyces sulfonofaciens]|uniref:PPM-type phosphatase domain-containing protein n=1 Tax=Streptomyces sulfonofaciens TaxID=68272 RepID=A0A919G598_9ACTN|nr:SpoIIE family protein phosphatase [Streptomyces sulfonofaciens]GHH77899.1 hypothetical protein GCM10018793_27110 [Streptomyces sulfonofaciens]